MPLRGMSCWDPTSSTMAAAAMFSKLSDKFSKLVCGISPPPDDDPRDRYRAGLRALLLLPSPERPPRGSSSPSASVRLVESPEAGDEDDDDAASASSESPPTEPRTASAAAAAEEEEMAAAAASVLFPCVGFASEHGYRVFSVADGRVLDGLPPMPPVPGRRLLPSPYGGAVLATDVCYRHPCHLADPFTGARAPLPDLPVPFSDREPVRCFPEEPLPRSKLVTDDGLAWDWSPRGVMVARGDTAFFRSHGAGGGWVPVHQAVLGWPMAVNYRAGRFFLLEKRTLLTTVIDAATLRRCAEIPPPPGAGDVDAAYLAPAADDAVLLVHRAGDRRRAAVFTEAYRARHLGGGRRAPRWARAHDLGGRAVFVDGAHAFTVAAGPAVRANRVFVLLACEVRRPCGRVAMAYDVGHCDVARPELMGRMKLDVGEVERMWGQPHWIMRREGSRELV